MMAALFLRHVRTWRSRQLTLALSLPPTNHFACGGFQSSTFVQGVLHSSSEANMAQKASGSLSACSYIEASETCAAATNAADGGNSRSSFRSASIWERGVSSAIACPLYQGSRSLRIAQKAACSLRQRETLQI